MSAITSESPMPLSEETTLNHKRPQVRVSVYSLTKMVLGSLGSNNTRKTPMPIDARAEILQSLPHS